MSRGRLVSGFIMLLVLGAIGLQSRLGCRPRGALQKTLNRVTPVGSDSAGVRAYIERNRWGRARVYPFGVQVGSGGVVKRNVGTASIRVRLPETMCPWPGPLVVGTLFEWALDDRGKVVEAFVTRYVDGP